MDHEEYFEDDRLIIPEYIKKMSLEEIKKEIERLEAEEFGKKKNLASA